jgi:hypothetical protein
MAAPPGLAHPLLAARQELGPVQAGTAAQPAPRAAQAALEQLSFLAAAVAVLVMVLALHLAALAGYTVLAVAAALRLQFPQVV